MRNPLMKIFMTPQMKDIFSRKVITRVSFQRLPSLSTLSRMCLRYLSSCISAGGTRRLHSSIIRPRATWLRDLKASRDRRTFSVWAEIPLWSFSSCSGRAKLSRRSSTESRSRGGKGSRSSWYELLPEKDGLRESPEAFDVADSAT